MKHMAWGKKEKTSEQREVVNWIIKLTESQTATWMMWAGAKNRNWCQRMRHCHSHDKMNPDSKIRMWRERSQEMRGFMTKVYQVTHSCDDISRELNSALFSHLPAVRCTHATPSSISLHECQHTAVLTCKSLGGQLSYMPRSGWAIR